ncbi:MAG: sigma-70 family RNA polymerase sigma factor [Oscillospiraceae bacterium]|nr:sigma-70 family RNA polymerase sigma factor [Oscillospiraceae bacterium]
MTREQMILDNLGLVGSCALRFMGKGVDYEDLYSAGCVGLIRAADGFDESRGFAFSTYAVPSILGEIRRIFRDGGAVKVSRTLKEKSRMLTAEKERMEKESGVEPTVSQLAEKMQLSVEETAQLLCVSMPVLSLTADDDESKQIDIPGEDEYTPIDDRISVRQVIATLSEKDRKLIELRFFDGFTQTQTAKVLGISQVQVSRREKIILSDMRRKLTG